MKLSKLNSCWTFIVFKLILAWAVFCVFAYFLEGGCGQ